MKKVFAFGVFLILVYCGGCSTGVDPSPAPGIVRMTLKSDDADTLLVILADTIQFSKYDYYDVMVSQGRLWRGENYSYLYTNTSTERNATTIINILQRKWKNGDIITPGDSVFDVDTWRSEYVSSTVYEWYVPPGTYDKLDFNLSGIEMYVVRPRRFQNPLQLPEGVRPIMTFPVSVTVEAGRTTEIQLVVSPFQSIRRYKDAYLFDRKVRIAKIQIL